MLTLYKRHSTPCLKDTKKGAGSINDVAMRRFFRGCNCACWVEGVHPLTHAYVRKALGTTSWKSAEAIKQNFESKEPDVLAAEGITIKDALDLWIKDAEHRGLADSSLRQLRPFRDRLMSFAADRGFTILRQLTNEQVYQFALSWTDEPTTRKQRLVRTRNFFEFTVERKWVAENPARGVKPPTVPMKQADPYTREEEAKIFSALATWPPTVKRGEPGSINRSTKNRQLWLRNPQAFRCLVFILRDTGLRISDALQVVPSMVALIGDRGGSITLVPMKTRTKGIVVTTYLRPETIQMLNAVKWVSGRYAFMERGPGESDMRKFSTFVQQQACAVYDALQRLGEMAGVDHVRAHRFRHTYAVRKLESGMMLENVSRLLGHASVLTTERFYAKWVKSRQERLADQVMTMWEKDAVQEVRKDEEPPQERPLIH